jgi:phage shock protein C
MICTHCQREIQDQSNFCAFCGSRQTSIGGHKRLLRSATDSKIAGVCGGIAEYFEVDSTLVRVIWAVLSLVPGAVAGGALIYIFCWIIIPKAAVAPIAVTHANLQETAK